MGKRGLGVVVLLALVAAGIPGTTTNTKADETIQLRFASLAPSGSSWMKVFKAWDASLRKRTKGRLKLQFYPGGAQGDERDFVRKMRVGQLDGGAVTATGLSMLVRSVLVLVVPGFLDTYEELDRVREKMAPQLNKLFDKEGFKLVGWGDAGKTRLFSEKPINKPSDIKSMRPWVWKDDLIFREFYKVINANPVRLGVPEVYPALQTHMIDTVAASALAAISLQWYTRVKYVTAHNSAIIVGATVMRKDKFEALPPDLREAFTDTAERAHALLNKTIRRDDNEAYSIVLKRGIKAIEAGENQAAWDQTNAQVRKNLTGRVYPANLLKQVQQAASK